ncbi:unnamed protein product [Rotaria socialis]|uniref:HAT C-terminal dimerisation domain-containing protein n=1 Tax=Rotaria socialis TaxID=392032 RepID=A0A821UJI2_9BILA|nr:unnamed protein product [Rotaria socialis]
MDKQNQQNEGTYDEVDRYIALKLGEDEQYSNPLDFWEKKDNQLAFPSLFQLAKRYFAIPCRSSAAERQFSAADNINMVELDFEEKLSKIDYPLVSIHLYSDETFKMEYLVVSS